MVVTVTHCTAFFHALCSWTNVFHFNCAAAATLRLNPGPARGRLEIYHDATPQGGTCGWGTICTDKFGRVDANVACRQLGFKRFYRWYKPSVGTGEVWLDELNCKASDTTLEACAARSGGWGNADPACKTHTKDAGVSCR